jgi:hypothetical protein
MNRRALFVAGIASLALVGGLGRHALSSRDSDDAGPGTAAAPPAALATDVAQLRREVASLRGAVAAGSQGGSSEVGEAASDTPDEAQPPSAEPPPMVGDAERRAFYDDLIEADPLDTAWAGPAEKSLTGALSGEAFRGSTVAAVQCRSTLCRIEVSHADGAAQDAFLPAAMSRPELDSRGLAQRIEDPDHPERRSTVIFLARQGHPLATPELP